MKLNDSVVVVTGAGSGMSRAIRDPGLLDEPASCGATDSKCRCASAWVVSQASGDFWTPRLP